MLAESRLGLPFGSRISQPLQEHGPHCPTFTTCEYCLCLLPSSPPKLLSIPAPGPFPASFCRHSNKWQSDRSLALTGLKITQITNFFSLLHLWPMFVLSSWTVPFFSWSCLFLALCFVRGRYLDMCLCFLEHHGLLRARFCTPSPLILQSS